MSWVATKDMPGYEGQYRVTCDGRVWSLPRMIKGTTGRWGVKTEYLRRLKGRWMKPAIHNHGYPVLTTGDSKQHYVHRLVAQLFAPRTNEGDDVVNHIDENTSNAHFSNLEWTDKAGNWEHSCRKGEG